MSPGSDSSPLLRGVLGYRGREGRCEEQEHAAAPQGKDA